jgi:hypothetical protein
MARYLDMFNNGASLSVSLLDCMAILRAAWTSVPAQLIRNCFETCNIQTTSAIEHAKGASLEHTDGEIEDLWKKGKTAG